MLRSQLNRPQRIALRYLAVSVKIGKMILPNAQSINLAFSANVLVGLGARLLAEFLPGRGKPAALDHATALIVRRLHPRLNDLTATRRRKARAATSQQTGDTQ